eukprot:9897810-Alexandrium_andersonii.AAC.1
MIEQSGNSMPVLLMSVPIIWAFGFTSLGNPTHQVPRSLLGMALQAAEEEAEADGDTPLPPLPSDTAVGSAVSVAAAGPASAAIVAAAPSRGSGSQGPRDAPQQVLRSLLRSVVSDPTDPEPAGRRALKRARSV